ncbi:MAG TPA: DUF5335 family protein [Tepidisphaeraceae bacterium]|jgi:hypothetical protein
MLTYEIPIEQWRPFLDNFSTVHRGDHVDVESVGGGAQPRSSVCDQPLLTVAALVEDGPDVSSRIQVVAGDETRPQTHTIDRPRQISVTERDDGFLVALQIASQDGSITSLRLEPEGQKGRYHPPEAYLG